MYVIQNKLYIKYFSKVDTTLTTEVQKNLKHKAYTFISEIIHDGEIRLGETISEKYISEKLGISRTPIREALNVLAQEGVVELIPNRGAFLKVPTIKEVWEIYQIREALEPLATFLCVDHFSEQQLEFYRTNIQECKKNPTPELLKISDEFHEQIIQLCANDYLINILKKLRLVIRRLQILSAKKPGRIQRSIHEHENILNAIFNRDGLEASQRMREHILSMRDSTLNLLKE